MTGKARTVTEADARKLLRDARRIVIKVGSSTLTRNGRLRPRKFGDLARQISGLMDAEREVVLVSSGAIAIGAAKLEWDNPGHSIPEMQAAAAVGQIGLVEHYQRRFAGHGRHVAQVLLTRVGLEDRERFLNARQTLQELLRLGVVPVVNENDTIATEEIRFGDNDNLSANIVSLVAADALVILSDVDGLFVEPPVEGKRKPSLFDVIEKITPEVERAAQGSSSAFGRGGMITKLEAARTAAHSGATTVLCNGATPNVVSRVLGGEPLGTVFLPATRMASRKHWLAFTTRTRGSLVLDEGASRAIQNRGRSLLSAGVVSHSGDFKRGDSVACFDPEGREIARGLCAYSAQEIERIKGIPARKIERVLGYSNGDEIIHRDNLVILTS
ncbi:MAG: glutamate 5-kinase [Deltaproteobacteria bacterium]|nr:glutamate 5-kinase [Deltaproteobacteria bacterium]